MCLRAYAHAFVCYTSSSASHWEFACREVSSGVGVLNTGHGILPNSAEESGGHARADSGAASAQGSEMGDGAETNELAGHLDYICNVKASPSCWKVKLLGKQCKRMRMHVNLPECCVSGLACI